MSSCQKYVFALGTSAEWIKIEPVVSRLTAEGSGCCLFQTFQQYSKTIAVPSGCETIDLRRDRRLRSLTSVWSVIPWLFIVSFNVFKELRRIRSNNQVSLIVHGDTMTAGLMAVVGFLLRVEVLHIEAGLRSNSIFNPFPEELSRKLVGLVATVHYAPSEEAVAVLKRGIRKSKVIVHTCGNTSQDALLDKLPKVQAVTPNEDKMSGRKSVLCVLHRAELLVSKQLTINVCEQLQEIAKSHDVEWICDDLAKRSLRRLGVIDSPETELFLTSPGYPNISFKDKLSHDLFAKRLSTADVIVTDSGGLQEECYVLGKPCLVIRRRTERADGIGSNAVLCPPESKDLLLHFERASSLQREPRTILESPSAIIVSHLKKKSSD